MPLPTLNEFSSYDIDTKEDTLPYLDDDDDGIPKAVSQLIGEMGDSQRLTELSDSQSIALKSVKQTREVPIIEIELMPSEELDIIERMLIDVRQRFQALFTHLTSNIIWRNQKLVNVGKLKRDLSAMLHKIGVENITILDSDKLTEIQNKETVSKADVDKLYELIISTLMGGDIEVLPALGLSGYSDNHEDISYAGLQISPDPKQIPIPRVAYHLFFNETKLVRLVIELPCIRYSKES